MCVCATSLALCWRQLTSFIALSSSFFSHFLEKSHKKKGKRKSDTLDSVRNDLQCKTKQKGHKKVLCLEFRKRARLSVWLTPSASVRASTSFCSPLSLFFFFLRSWLLANIHHATIYG